MKGTLKLVTFSCIFILIITGIRASLPHVRTWFNDVTPQSNYSSDNQGVKQASNWTKKTDVVDIKNQADLISTELNNSEREPTKKELDIINAGTSMIQQKQERKETDVAMPSVGHPECKCSQFGREFIDEDSGRAFTQGEIDLWYASCNHSYEAWDAARLHYERLVKLNYSPDILIVGHLGLSQIYGNGLGIERDEGKALSHSRKAVTLDKTSVEAHFMRCFFAFRQFELAEEGEVLEACQAYLELADTDMISKELAAQRRAVAENNISVKTNL